MSWLTVDEAKIYLFSDDYSLSTTEETLISKLCSSAETFIENYCNRPIEKTTIHEYNVYCSADGKLQLKYFPVSDLILSYYDGYENVIIPSDKYTLDGDSGLIMLKPEVILNNPYIAEYKAGWDVVPDDLKSAGYMLVSFWYDKIRNKTVDSASMSGFGTSVAFITREYELPPVIKGILNKYVLVG